MAITLDNASFLAFSGRFIDVNKALINETIVLDADFVSVTGSEGKGMNWPAGWAVLK
jgi:hypothetical protein